MKKIILLSFFLVGVLSLYARENYVTTSDGVQLFVTVKGKGIPCLYLHGGPGAGSYFLERLMGEFLEKNFQMVYLDQRGVGRSSSPADGNYSMERMVQDFEEVRKALNIEQWITLGHSFGGILQMGYATSYPEKIKGMVMVNCCLDASDSYTRSWAPKAFSLLDIKEKEFYMDESLSLKTRWDSLITQLIDQKIIWKMGFSNFDDARAMGNVCSEIPVGNTDFENVALGINDYLYDFTGDTKNMIMPVLFFYGKKDWMVGPAHFKHIHFPNMLPWEADTEHMTPFLSDSLKLHDAINAYVKNYNLGVPQESK